MAISKDRKKELVDQYTELIKNSNAMFLTEYTGLSVMDMQQLRGDLREVDGVYLVTKNTLLRYALEQSGNPVPADYLIGQLATGFALNEAPALAKMLTKFAENSEQFAVRFGIMDDMILTTEQVEVLANLPTMDELRAQLLGVVQGPARNVASVVAGGVRQVVNVLDAYSAQEAEAEPVAS